MEVHVTMISAKSFPIIVDPLSRIKDLKAKMDEIEYIRPESQRLFSGDTLLEVSLSLGSTFPRRRRLVWWFENIYK